MIFERLALAYTYLVGISIEIHILDRFSAVVVEDKNVDIQNRSIHNITNNTYYTA